MPEDVVLTKNRRDFSPPRLANQLYDSDEAAGEISISGAKLKQEDDNKNGEAAMITGLKKRYNYSRFAE